jgi:hypothetical protein
MIEPSADGFIDVDRPEADVFDPCALSSFKGKPITIDHLATEHPDGWRRLAVEHIAHARRAAAVSILTWW